MIIVPTSGPVAIVDDSAADRMILREVWKQLPLSNALIEFPGGPEFLDHMARVDKGEEPMPASVLLDVNLPRMTGFEVVTELRADAPFAEVPMVVLISSSDSERDAKRALECGANAFLTKQPGFPEFVALFERSFAPAQ